MYVHGSYVHQKCSNYTLTNLLFDLCKLVWIIDPFVTCFNAHPGAPTHPSYPRSATSKIMYPNSFRCFHFGMHIWVFQGVWGCVRNYQLVFYYLYSCVDALLECYCLNDVITLKYVINHNVTTFLHALNCFNDVVGLMLLHNIHVLMLLFMCCYFTSVHCYLNGVVAQVHVTNRGIVVFKVLLP
jgi:hypothetical protein